MESVKDYLEKLEINNNILNKQLSDVNISKVTYFKEERLIYIYLSSKNIISYDYIELFRNELKQRLDYFRDIKVKIRYIKLEKQKTKDIIKKYWNNIVHILTVLCPSLNGWVKGIEYMCIDDTLKIKIPSDLFYKRLMKQNAIQVLKNVLSEEAGIDIDIIFEKSINKGPDVDKLIEQNDSLVEAMVKERISENIILDEDEEVNENKAIEIVSKEEYVYGENVNAPVEKINRLNQNSGTVCIVGEVFDVELKELRNGKVLLIAAVTDYTSSINCKLFLNDMNKDKVIDSVTKGAYLKIKGDALYDNYQRELTMTISGIKEEKKEERMDTSDEKRVELHAHTQMSSMDAICPTKKLVERAAKWGHPAIAITDHGVVQAFPEAMDAAKKHGIKVIYGVEGYLAEDEVPIVKDPNKKGLDQTFVVFDIETTGFSNTNDKITEIGAVKIENFKVVDRFSELVNPEVDISYKIQEFTGITNDLVSDKPTIEEILPKFLEFVGDSVLVAHNAEFDMGFISQKSREQGLEFKNKSVDTLTLARVLLPHLKRHRLNVIAKDLGIPLLNHHRAVDDAEATAHIFIKFLEMLKKQGVEVLSDVNEKLGGLDYTKIATNHITLLAKNYTGLKNLYKIVSDAHVNHFYRAPRILRSVLEKYKEGLIIGSACEAGQVFNAVKKNVTDEEMEKIIDLYDYIEVMPIDNNRFMIEKGEVKDEEELRYLNK